MVFNKFLDMLMAFIIILVLLITCVMFVDIWNRDTFKYDCLSHHGHLEIYEDKINCSYPLPMR